MAYRCFGVEIFCYIGNPVTPGVRLFGRALFWRGGGGGWFSCIARKVGFLIECWLSIASYLRVFGAEGEGLALGRCCRQTLKPLLRKPDPYLIPVALSMKSARLCNVSGEGKRRKFEQALLRLSRLLQSFNEISSRLVAFQTED